MITNFEDITSELTEYEQGILLPQITSYLKVCIGSENAVRNKDICRIFSEKGYRVTEARIRKIINCIRLNGLVPHLIANSKGYFCATSIEEVEGYLESLDQRASAIWAVRAALKRELSGKLFL